MDEVARLPSLRYPIRFKESQIAAIVLTARSYTRLEALSVESVQQLSTVFDRGLDVDDLVLTHRYTHGAHLFNSRKLRLRLLLSHSHTPRLWLLLSHSHTPRLVILLLVVTTSGRRLLPIPIPVLSAIASWTDSLVSIRRPIGIHPPTTGWTILEPAPPSISLRVHTASAADGISWVGVGVVVRWLPSSGEGEGCEGEDDGEEEMEVKGWSDGHVYSQMG